MIRAHSAISHFGDSSKRLAVSHADKAKLAMSLMDRPLLTRAAIPPVTNFCCLLALSIDAWYRTPNIDMIVNTIQNKATTGEGIAGRAKLRRYTRATRRTALVKYIPSCLAGNLPWLERSLLAVSFVIFSSIHPMGDYPSCV